MTQAQDDAFALKAKAYVVPATRPSQTVYNTFRVDTNAWLTARAPAPQPVPVLTPENFTLAAGYGMDDLVGHVTATNAPVSYEIVTGNGLGYFAIFPSGNLRTSETIAVPPGSYTLGIRGSNALGTGLVALFGVTAQGVVQPPPPPPPGAWPDATNTGVPAGTTLTASGSINATTVGQIVEGKNVTGKIEVSANNVTVRKCKVKLAADYCVDINPGVTGTRVEDCELDGSGIGGAHGINGSGTFLRNNIHHIENGIADPGTGTIIQDNYIHDFNSAGAPHYDGIQIDGGANNVLIEHNTIILNQGQTAAVMIDNWAGGNNAVNVNNNLLGGGSYTCYADGRFNNSSMTNLRYTNNRIRPGQFGAFFISGAPGIVITGNVNDFTGAPVS